MTAIQNLTITIPRADLLNTLQTKRTDLETAWDAEIQRLTDERDNLPNTATALKDWHIEIAAMLSAGEARVSAKGDVFAVDPDVKEVPTKPNQSSVSSNKRDLNVFIENAKLGKDRALASLDASLNLLNLATNTDVEIPVSEYERLLATGIERDPYGRNWYR